MKLASTHIIALGWNAATEESGARETDVSCEVTSVTWVGSAHVQLIIIILGIEHRTLEYY